MKELFAKIEKVMRAKVLAEHAYGAEALVAKCDEEIAESRVEFLAAVPESRRSEAAVAFDGDLERLYVHCRSRYEAA